MTKSIVYPFVLTLGSSLEGDSNVNSTPSFCGDKTLLFGASYNLIVGKLGANGIKLLISVSITLSNFSPFSKTGYLFTL